MRVRLDEAVAQQDGITRSQARSLIMEGRVSVDGAWRPRPARASSRRAHRDRAAAALRQPRRRKTRARAERVRYRRARARGARRRRVDRRIHRCLLAARRGARDRGGRRLRPTRLAAAQRSARDGDGARRTFERCPTMRFPKASTSSRSMRRSSRCARSSRARSRYLRADGTIVALVKPQFEAGRERLGSGRRRARSGDAPRRCCAKCATRRRRLGSCRSRLRSRRCAGPPGTASS